MTPALLEIYCRAQALITRREFYVAYDRTGNAQLTGPVPPTEWDALENEFSAIADRCKELQST